LSRARGEDQRVRDPNGIQRLLAVFLATFLKKSGHIKKNRMKYKKIMKRKGGKNSDGVSTSGKSNQVRVFEQADEDPRDVLTA